MNTWITAGGLLGGIGLLLLGMGLMIDGLKLAASPVLKRMLAHSTKTRLRALQGHRPDLARLRSNSTQWSYANSVSIRELRVYNVQDGG